MVLTIQFYFNYFILLFSHFHFYYLCCVYFSWLRQQLKLSNSAQLWNSQYQTNLRRDKKRFLQALKITIKKKENRRETIKVRCIDCFMKFYGDCKVFAKEDENKQSL